MELVIRMKTLTRFLIFVAAILIWLVVLVILNGQYLNVDAGVIVGSAALLAVVTTFGVAKALRT